MGNRKGIIYETNERLNAKTQLKVSRFEEKKARREAGECFWSFSSGLIHSHGTRNAYQQHVMHFVQWVRSNYQIRRLEVLDQRADELATEYLAEHLKQGYSSYTVQAERAALRLFFDNRQLAEQLVIPPRKRERITRSRKETVREKEFQPVNWQALIRFLQATGLRRAEVTLLQVGDIQKDIVTGDVEVVVKKGHGKGGRPRSVPVLPGHGQDVLCLYDGRESQELVFPNIPTHLDIHAIRREYAQSYYQHLSRRDLPPLTGRLKRSDYDEAAVLQVSKALGHNRKDVILRHYLR
jgi:integrase